MSTVLEVNPGEIKETVRRDRCDWLAAIYNLLIDQPEGRNIIQRLIMDDPEEQLVDAAHYQGSMEHFRLSQGGKQQLQVRKCNICCPNLHFSPSESKLVYSYILEHMTMKMSSVWYSETSDKGHS